MNNSIVLCICGTLVIIASLIAGCMLPIPNPGYGAIASFLTFMFGVLMIMFSITTDEQEDAR